MRSRDEKSQTANSVKPGRKRDGNIAFMYV